MPERARLRRFGLLLALSFPVTGLIAWAAVAVVIGERRLEGPDAVPMLGPLLFLAPLLVGLAMVGWSLTSLPVPAGPVPLGFDVGLGLLLLAVGVVALTGTDAGDASIGGGLLVLAGAVMSALGLVRILDRSVRAGGRSDPDRDGHLG